MGEIEGLAEAKQGLLSRWWSVFVVGAILWAPLLTACIWQYHGRWAAIFDMALFEMRVRDVGSLHPPLLGLGGRLSRWPEIGCHPGPLAFYLLAPVYRLFGSTYWALRVSIATAAGGAMLLALVIGRRRAGSAGVIAIGIVLALFEMGFGLLVLTEPWNPYVPVIWFFPFLLAIWSVFAGDVKFLPVAAAIGSLCAQTHIPYLGICGILCALAFAVVFARWISARRRGQPSRELGLVCAITAGITALLWLPPVIDELSRKRGNITIVAEYVRNPPETFVGFAGAVDLLCKRLDIWFLFDETFKQPGLLRVPLGLEPSPLRGKIVLGVWLICVVVAALRRDRFLLTLHATALVALLVAVVNLSRIIGFPYVYVVFSGWSVGALVFVAILATIGRVLKARRLGSSRSAQAAAAALGLLVIAACAFRIGAKAEDSVSRDAASSKQLAMLAPTAAEKIRTAVPTGKLGPYLVTWDDALYGGGQGFGLLNELERYHIKAYAASGFASIVGAHRTIEPAKAVARIHIANGGWVQQTRAIPGAVELAYSDVRTPEQRQEYDKAVVSLVSALSKIQRLDAVATIDKHLDAVNVPGLGPWEGLTIARIAEIGMPAAVFVLPNQ